MKTTETEANILGVCHDYRRLEEKVIKMTLQTMKRKKTALSSHQAGAGTLLRLVHPPRKRKLTHLPREHFGRQ